MQCLKNEELKNKTTIKIGGTAKNFFIPENETELVEIVKNYDDLHFIGGGSNLLINDKNTYKNVVSLREFNKEIKIIDKNLVYVGASVALQKLILFINENELGGIEFLYSVPGLVGGAICMNAGRGRNLNENISDFLISVRVLQENGEIVELKKEDCNFTYRNSKFKNSKDIVLSAIFEFKDQEKETSRKLREERIQYCKKVQDNSYPNFGTVFCQQNKYILKIIRKLNIKTGDACFSKKTNNWILNKGNATFNDVYSLIEKTKKIHKFCGIECKEEICIWK